MQEKDAAQLITDHEFLTLLQEAKLKKPEATLQLLHLFREDILNISRYIHLPKEDAISTITLEFLEFIQQRESRPKGEP
ncbi:hypothetical protein [Paenibacillus tepidiphilus]|uniref:hypothetical protein n=1 Tax=Paenibacillus tepidiphilus TaxID=2608683 RepID=UPI00123A0A55|nr:hypothetical protein [Paenibacillus tepidiphilus]